ncbi:MAG TPA: PP2C family serine/threonine-protein phosphatase [Ktedonobacteraceae bacterium]|nr:PP2C family serine/threonine-protein phosphatase [Ktedonobacteraceae bacterium]
MTETHDTWRLIGASVRGANHVRQGIRNQDFIGWEPADACMNESGTVTPFVISLADGHGSEKYFRSHIGAQFAVEIANEVLYQFAQTHVHLPFSRIEVDAERLPHQILAQWKQDVERNWENDRQTDDEIAWLEEHVSARKAIAKNPTIPYGTTLISTLITERFILYCQVGDGNVITVAGDGTYAEPVPPDERNFANEAVSLCNAVPKDFQLHIQQLGTKQPALIMLATDGYVNSFRDIHGFYKVATDIWDLIINSGEDGLQMVANSLEGWLERSTQMGSGDDISVGILWHMSAFQGQIARAEAPSSSTEIVSPSPLPGVALTNIDDESTQPAPTSRANS